MLPDQPPRLTGEVENDEAAQGRTDVTPVHWLLLALRASLFRKKLAFAVFVAGVALTIAFAKTRVPLYRVYTKILAQRSQALPPSARGPYDEVPTRSAWEMVHRRENLLTIVKETRLAEGFGVASDATIDLRTRVKRALRLERPEITPRDPVDNLVLILDRELAVIVQEGTITIQLDWPDPNQAHAVVQAALQNFLEARHVQEVTAIDEVISVLRGRAATLRKNLEEVTLEARRRPSTPPRTESPPVARQPGGEELARLQSLLESKQRAIQDVEDFRRRRQAELRAQLEQSLNTLSEAHPTVIALRQEIAAVSRESPQVENLRDEERKLRAQYADRAARAGTPVVAVAPALPEPARRIEDDPRVVEARMESEQMNAKVAAAQADLDAARAAFKYRYNVVWPPQVPRDPYRNSRVKIVAAGMLASLLLAIVAAAAPDILRGRVIQRWQVERGLGLSVLGDFRRNS